MNIAFVTTLPSRLLLPWGALSSILARVTGDAMFRKSLISILDQAVVSGMNFAVTIILSRCAGKAEVGLYYLALQLVFFLRGLQEQLIGAPYMIYGGRKTGAAGQSFAGSSLMHELLFLLLASGGLQLASYSGWCGPEISELLQLLVIATPLLLCREFIRQFSFAQLRVMEALAIDVTVVVLQLAAFYWAAEHHAINTFTTYVILAGGCGFACAAWFFARRGTFQPTANRVVRDWSANWKFAQWALATQLLGCSMPYVLPWVVAATHGSQATGSFGVGTTLIGIANMFVLGVSNFVCPHAARAYASRGKRELMKVLTAAGGMYVAVLGPFFAIMLLRGDWFMNWVYGPQFADTGGILAILAAGALANSLGIVAGNGLWAMERPAANFRADLSAMFTWILAAILLIGTYGPWGAAWASSLGTIVSAVIRIHTLRTELRTV